MKGTVNAALQIMIPVEVEDGSGQRHTISAQFDSGYNGSLTLPPAQVAALGLPWIGSVYAKLADGSSRRINIYRATIVWNGQPLAVEIDAPNSDPLIGTGLLERHRATIEMIPGGTVTIDPLP
jgi:clan AA aspartic protease